MLKSKIVLTVLSVETLAIIGIVLHALTFGAPSHNERLDEKRELVRNLGLTDLAIWTEARYTRHPSQTDFFTAFQDFPGSPDHFPAGSLMAPVRSSVQDNQ